ncbi:MAG TPA: YeeE/YedE family protein [Kiloniellales bacterium]|nr:YeeE/YedE family protein [Kiloniellales bacterium]
MEAWLWAAVGGALIGLSAGLLMVLLGRTAGISGILGSLLPPQPAGDWLWRAGFLAGLVLGPLVLLLVRGQSGIGKPALGLAGMAVAGLLVGAGTALGSGCTSGHGVCGLARLSPRSLAATATFMGVALVVVALMRHVF